MGEDSFKHEVLAMEVALKGSPLNYSHHAIFDKQAVLTIVKPVKPKKLSIHIYLCEPGSYKEIDSGEIDISPNASFDTIVKSCEGVVKVDINAYHGKHKKNYSMKYYH